MLLIWELSVLSSVSLDNVFQCTEHVVFGYYVIF